MTMNTDIILKILVSSAIILLPVAQIFRDWKFSDKRTKKHHIITRSIIVSWLVVSLVSVVIIYRSDKQIQNYKNQERKIAMQSALRMHQLLKVYIDDYYRHIDMLINFSSYSEIQRIPVKKNFPFDRMKNLHDISPFWGDKIGEKNYSALLNSQSRLLEQMKNCLLQVDLEYYPDLSNIILQFIKETEFINPGKNFDIPERLNNGKREDNKDFVDEMIEKASANVHYPADSNKYSSNMLFPYVRLYNMLNKQIELIEKYNSITKNIEGEGKPNKLIQRTQRTAAD